MMQIHPIEYLLRIEPDLETFRCPGRVVVMVEATEPVERVSLDAVETTVSGCRAGTRVGDPDGPAAPAEFSLDEEAGRLDITLPQPMSGRFAVAVDFESQINDKMAGFYRSRYVQDGRTSYVGVTQFEERDARRAFPCFDEPEMKAVFRIEFVIDANLTAMANTPIVSEAVMEDGRKLVVFEPTPRMSTYLLFFGVGDFEYITDDSWRVPIRAAAVPGRVQHAGKGIEFARDALQFCETFTGIEYPIGKMDLIAVPDFAYGAMENFGAITYRENYLLAYPGKTSRSDLKAIASIAAHEVAHMWFGDLVSPAGWNYIWLNEAFATYFGNVVLADTHPEWETMKDFVAGTMQGAMGRDSLVQTVPIELPSGDEVEVDPSTAPIIYSKAGSILHMIRAYLGDEGFRGGVRSFLSEYAFDCAETDGFIQSFSNGVNEPIDRVLLSWIRQKGFPLVHAERNERSLSLSQTRFSLLGAELSEQWLVPITLLLILEDGTRETKSFLLEGRSAEIDLPEGLRALKVNAEQAGFYRVSYDQDSLAALGAAARDGLLSAVDRFGLVADLAALATRGDVDVAEVLDFIEEYYSEETDPLVLRTTAGTTASYMRNLPSKKERAAALAVRLFEKPLAELGYAPKEDETFSQTQLRNTLVDALVEAGSEEVGAWYSTRFEEIRAGSEVPSDIYALSLGIGVSRDPGAAEWLKERIDSDETNELEKRHMLSALGRVRDVPTAKSILAYALESVPVKNRLHLLGSMGGNPIVRSMLWDWCVDNLAELEGIHSYHFASTLATAIPTADIFREDEVRSFMQKYMSSHPKAPRGTIDMSLERLAIIARFVKRYES